MLEMQATQCSLMRAAGWTCRWHCAQVVQDKIIVTKAKHDNDLIDLQLYSTPIIE